MDELMAAADLVISKPGGLTTSEALAGGAALPIANPVPGQENREQRLPSRNGAAGKSIACGTLAYKLSRLLAEPELAADEAAARRWAAAGGLRRRPGGLAVEAGCRNVAMSRRIWVARP